MRPRLDNSTTLQRWLWEEAGLSQLSEVDKTCSTVMEVAKHYLEESVFGKAFVTYVNTLGSKPEQGA